VIAAKPLSRPEWCHQVRREKFRRLSAGFATHRTSMQWILQKFEDTQRLAAALDRLEIAYTWHNVIPFVGELVPRPVIVDPAAVVMFGAYSLWRNAEENGYWPGVFKLRPFVQEEVWHPYLLNGADALFMTLREVPERLADDGRQWFLRPVDDSKEEAGNVKSTSEIIRMAEKVLMLEEDEIPNGSLRHDTLLMFTKPVRIMREWRLWAVDGRIVTYSLYKEGSRVVHRHEIDDDALVFGQHMVDVNPGYSRAYVIDICRTEEGLKLLETNCVNAAGFYEADLLRLAAAIDGLVRD
jgi:ATP-grasp domain, R2K clade family 3